MSTLTDNLNQIYTTKLQIKQVIGTQSDVFADYPAYIQAAIESGGGGGLDWDDVAAYGYIVPAGYVTVSSNGNYDTSTYEYTYVNVPNTIPSGYTYTYGTYNITNNGTFDVKSYESAYVNVEGGGITPTGTYNITNNGTFDVTTYASAYVNVEGGGGSGLTTHTVSGIYECYPDDEITPYIAQIMANEIDGDEGDMSTAVFSTKYWGYCYPQSMVVAENPVLDIDNAGLGFSLVSYTNLVKREYSYNSLPDFNTYHGYTYSYEYVDGDDQTQTYEFNYGDSLLYKTNLEITTLSGRAKWSPNDYYNGVWNVVDIKQPGLKGYYDSENDSYSSKDLRIATLTLAESDGGPVTQFTSTYHGAASYTTGFDPRTLIGYTWSAVVDGRGWLVDLIDNEDTLAASDMWFVNANDPEDIFYPDDEVDEFVHEITLDESNYEFSGFYPIVTIGNADYNVAIESMGADNILGGDSNIAASGTSYITGTLNGENYYADFGSINNNYSEWDLTLEVHVPNRFFTENENNITVEWTFTGTANE